MSKVKKYFLNLLLSIDQTVNALFGGDRDVTVSDRLGRFKKAHGGTIPWRYPFRKSLDWVLDKIDPNHSIDAIEEDETAEDAIFVMEGSDERDERNA